MGRPIKEDKKAFFMQRFSYDNGFKSELLKFFRNIERDPRFNDTENKNLNKSRFSRAVRGLIIAYNRGVEIATINKE